MNLVLSGPVDDVFLLAVDDLADSGGVVRLHERACRLEDVRSSTVLRERIAQLCETARIDHTFMDAAPGLPRSGLLVMDMDSTLITIECIDEIADLVGKKAEVAAITEATMRGEIGDFAESLTRRVGLLAGADEGALRRVFDERLQLSPGADVLLAATLEANCHTLLVSGGFTYFTDRLVAMLGLEAGHANTLEIIDGRLTGRLVGPIFGGAEKADIVRETMTLHRQTPATTIVIGDGANDLPMMRLVEHSVAYRGKPPVVAAARHAVHFGTLATVVDYFS